MIPLIHLHEQLIDSLRRYLYRYLQLAATMTSTLSQTTQARIRNSSGNKSRRWRFCRPFRRAARCDNKHCDKRASASVASWAGYRNYISPTWRSSWRSCDFESKLYALERWCRWLLTCIRQSLSPEWAPSFATHSSGRSLCWEGNWVGFFSETTCKTFLRRRKGRSHLEVRFGMLGSWNESWRFGKNCNL